MRDNTKFSLTIGESTMTMLTKRELAYQVFAEAIRRGVSPKRLGMALPWKQSRLYMAVDGNVNEYEFTQQARNTLARNGRSFDPTRYFIESQKLIHANGQTIAVTNQWGTFTLPSVREMIQQMRASDIRFTPCS